MSLLPDDLRLLRVGSELPHLSELDVPAHGRAVPGEPELQLRAVLRRTGSAVPKLPCELSPLLRGVSGAVSVLFFWALPDSLRDLRRAGRLPRRDLAGRGALQALLSELQEMRGVRRAVPRVPARTIPVPADLRLELPLRPFPGIQHAILQPLRSDEVPPVSDELLLLPRVRRGL